MDIPTLEKDTWWAALRNIDEEKYEKLLDSSTLIIRGTFGTVRQTLWQDVPVVIKSFQSTDEEHRCDQVRWHLLCTAHPNVVRVLAAGPNIPTRIGFYVLEYAKDFSLHEVLHRQPNIHYTLAHAVQWVTQAAEAADYMHRHCQPALVHGDLKPANMLLFDEGRWLKLTDFGTTLPLGEEREKRQAATVIYTAPEIAYLSADRSFFLPSLASSPERIQDMRLCYTEKCDVYSLAISFWEILSRQQPFASPDRIKSYWGLYRRRPGQLKDCPQMLWQLLESGWSEQPDQRPSMLSIAQFLQYAQNKLLLSGSTSTLPPLMSSDHSSLLQTIGDGCEEHTDS